MPHHRRSSLERDVYRALRLYNDAKAIRHGRIGRRVARRIYGRATGRAAARLFR